MSFEVSVNDLLLAFPSLRPFVRTAVVLREEEGTPEAGDSSIGGPLLWPADEPWPMCAEQHLVELRKPFPPEHTEALTELHRKEMEAMYQSVELTADEHELMLSLFEGGTMAIDWVAMETYGPVQEVPAAEVAVVPVAQVFAADVPGDWWPEGKDLLQVLWCPNDHSELVGRDGYYGAPAVLLIWRTTADIHEVLTVPAKPRICDDTFYLPKPCMLHPARTPDLPTPGELPADLQEQADTWANSQGVDYAQVACLQGWKIGGWPFWNGADPQEINCSVCHSPMRLFFNISSVGAPQVNVGRWGDLGIFACPTDLSHPIHSQVVQ